ncbi:hypothetical protein AMATHDRAFT_75540 [Amanita thiersii Skay4041]|uniref:Aminopeptidase P N-terminal domain-containing protein n=1 Tax=Amanita thiersii Skay4041 TaxID=703135 RepID=A0A2A9NKF3_9AGAR|nr:hypothetical protein AMATHDRAFT_75540 [Amanita thiersii Skay4041]
MNFLARHLGRPCLVRTYATEAALVKPSRYGQPLFHSHPHLVKPNELTPGIPVEEYECRRRKLIDSLPSDSMVISVSAPVKYMSKKCLHSLRSYKYRQASDFWYLTGFMEPDSALIMEKTSSSPKGYRMTLFCSGSDMEKEKWEGARTSLDDVMSIFRADDAKHISTFSSQLKQLLPSFSNVFVDLSDFHTHGHHTRRSARAVTRSLLKYLSSTTATESPDFDSILASIANSKRRSLSPEVAKLRAIKSQAEQRVMRAAADISGRAHTKTMLYARPGISEAALAAHFEYLCAMSGAQRPAYVPVVASGPNALIIHYTHNDHLVQPNDVVLVDAGCEYNGYASDITRSFPASGTFNGPQRDLYSAVLSAQKTLISLCTERASLSLYDLHRQSCDLLRQELAQIGFNTLFTGDLERLLYPHFLSHPIGIGMFHSYHTVLHKIHLMSDLHESNHFDRGATLKAGMVITIEPGIYVPPISRFPTHFHNIGILSAPKEISDVEGACRGLLGLEPY